jgi:xanthine dehydrogenase accessory factor
VNENESLGMAICEQLCRESPVVLISVLDIQGSSPRHTGSKMMVSARGNFGTIGGSLLEATAIRQALQTLNSGRSTLMEFELTGKDAYAPGMICGGKVELLLDLLKATSENRQIFQAWVEASRKGQDFYFLTQFQPNEKLVQVLGRGLLFPGGNIIGDINLGNDGLDAVRAELHNISAAAILPVRDTRVVIHRIQKVKTLYCFGAGHVALPTAHIAALVGFRVVIIDDRSEFANRERFPEASEIRVVKDLAHSLEGLEIDGDAFIVIVTRGHQYDRAVLEQVLKTPAQYIGMISSRKKREAIYAALKAEGVTETELDRVHSPIGVPIAGETPEEIAVSIVAELIDERGKKSASD